MFCTRARSCARADDAKIVRSRDAQCKNSGITLTVKYYVKFKYCMSVSNLLKCISVCINKV